MFPMSLARPVLLAVAFLVLVVPTMASESFRFVQITDTHITVGARFGPNLQAIISEVNTMDPKPAFMLCTGDETEMGFGEEYAKYKELVSPLTIPIYNVMGNHEAKWSNWGKSGVREFLKQDPYYSFDHGGIHFIGLDTTMWLEHNGFLDQSQLTWLKADLEKVGREKPVVLFYHHCPGFLPNELELLRLLRPYNVRLALVGHGHTFKTWKRNGITFQMTKAVMNDQGGYRILEVSDNEIRSFMKEVGKPAVEDGVIPLVPAANPVMLMQPRSGDMLEGPVALRAAITSDLEQIECGIDENYQPIVPNKDGICETKIQWDGTPGWHTLSIHGKDSKGMEWVDSATIRINGEAQEAWRVRVSGAVQRPITAQAGRIYFGAWGGDVYCLESRTGREVWRHNAGSDVICEIAVDTGRAYLGTTDGRVMALDASNGKSLWEYRTKAPIQGSPVIGEGAVYIGSGDHAFYALDAGTGKLRWKYETGGLIQSKPILMNHTLYFGSWDQHFYALSAEDGTLRWKTKIGELIYFSPANSNPSTDGKHIVVAGTPWHAGNPDLYCMDAKNGQILWQMRNPGQKSSCAFNSPFVSADRFYVAALNGGIFCQSVADGKEIWRSSTGQETYDDSPVAHGDQVYIGGLIGGLYAFNAADGKKEWSYSTGGGYLFASPTVCDGLVIIPATDGTITAVREHAK